MSQQPQILQLISSLDPYGAAYTLRLLLDRLPRELAKMRVVTLSADRRELECWRARGIDCQSVQRRWQWDPIALGRLARILRNADPTLIHAWDLPSLIYQTAYQSLARGRRRAAPLVANLSSDRSWTHSSSGLLRTATRQAAQVVVASERQRRLAAAQGIAQEKLQWIPLAAEAAATAATPRDDFLEQLRLPPNARLIVVAGPLLQQHRTDDAIWNFELVRVLHPNCRLLIVGDGPQRQRLERFARLVCEPGSVRFLGQRDDLPEILQQADLFWQASESQTTPDAMLQAMAAGLPVVASDIGAHRELIEADRTGLLAPVGSRADWGRLTDRLLNDTASARQIGAAAAQYAAQNFSVERLSNSYAKLYTDLLLPMR